MSEDDRYKHKTTIEVVVKGQDETALKSTVEAITYSLDSIKRRLDAASPRRSMIEVME
ncbi:MAG: hypothetical protein GF414_08575 [Candidatus Altiarchaeales archaeon]|nr:hypothetical protein [Candidatus Altiarchaeales archaeon]